MNVLEEMELLKLYVRGVAQSAVNPAAYTQHLEDVDKLTQRKHDEALTFVADKSIRSQAGVPQAAAFSM